MYDNSRLLEIVTFLFKAILNYLFIEIALFIFDLFYLHILQSHGSVSPGLELYWQVKSNLVYYSSMIIPLLSGVVFITWFYREYWNLQKRYYHHEFRYKPITAVLAFIVPLFNLYMPYILMKEIVSGYIDYYRKNININYVTIWWGTCLVHFTYNKFLSLQTPVGVDEFINCTYHSIISDIFGVVSLMILILLLKQFEINE